MAFVENYTLLSWFSAILGAWVLQKVLVYRLFASVQEVRLASQRKFQMFKIYWPPYWRTNKGSPLTWRLHTRLYNFARNILTNISTLGQRTHRKLRELCPLFIVYNITISWPYPLHDFLFYFYYVTMHILYNKRQNPVELKQEKWFDKIWPILELNLSFYFQIHFLEYFVHIRIPFTRNNKCSRYIIPWGIYC